MWLLKNRTLRQIIFGKKAFTTGREKELLKKLQRNFSSFKSRGAMRGRLSGSDIFHRAQGSCFLTVNSIGNPKKESILAFDERVKITPGADLFLYLSPHRNAKKQGLGKTLAVGHLKGTRGGQTYVIKKALSKLQIYQSVVIYSKQFEVIVSYAPLS